MRSISEISGALDFEWSDDYEIWYIYVAQNHWMSLFDFTNEGLYVDFFIGVEHSFHNNDHLKIDFAYHSKEFERATLFDSNDDFIKTILLPRYHDDTVTYLCCAGDFFEGRAFLFLLK